MSPIGRLFIVLNLVLAGAFVGFAGTYLQKASTWKEQHDALQTSSDALLETARAQLEVKQKEINDLNVRFTAADNKANTAQVTITDLSNEKERLEAMLASIQGDIKSLVASSSTIASNVDRATTEASSAREQSIEAASARDAALREKDTAVADLRDVQSEVDILKTSVEEKDKQIGDLESEVRQQKTLLDIAIGKGFSVAGAQPVLGGTVSHVGPQGTLLTITVTENPAGTVLRPGLRFAILEGDDYKGEATIEEVEGQNAFCKMVSSAGGSMVKVGDAASTRFGGR